MTFTQILDEYLDLRDVHNFQTPREQQDSLLRTDRINRMALLRKQLDDAVAALNDNLIAIDEIKLPEPVNEPLPDAPKVTCKALAQELVRTGHDGIDFQLERDMKMRGTATSMNKRNAKVRWRLVGDQDGFIQLLVNSSRLGFVKTVDDVTALMNGSVFKS